MTNTAITVVPVDSAKLWGEFHRLPFRLYKDDPNWVPPLFLERSTHFQPKHNAFFQHAKAAFWLAFKNGEPVGRITAQIDFLHLEQHNDATGHFGFLEATDDPNVFAALLKTAEDWLSAEGMKRVLGPVSFNMWDEPGLLVEGFETPPNVLMGHHLPYYQPRIIEQGYAKAQDLLAYERPVHAPLPETFQRLVDKGRARNVVHLRSIRMDKKNLPSEVALIRDIINDSWAENWGFVPVTLAEIQEIANLFKVFLKPDALIIAEYRGEAIGVGMMLPNINEVIYDLKGKLFPFGIVKMLWRLKTKSVKTGRVALLGVRRRFWNTPVGAIAAIMTIEKAQHSSLANDGVTAELSWILDSNQRIKAVIEAAGGKINKRYRIFEKALG